MCEGGERICDRGGECVGCVRGESRTRDSGSGDV